MQRSSSKWFLVALAVALIGLVAAGAAQAVLVGSNHDMVSRYTYTGAQAKSGACSFCHIPHGAASARLFPPSNDNVPGAEWGADPNAKMCWQCHGLTTYAGAQDVNPFQNLASGMHGRDYSKLETWGDWTKAGIEASGIPYVVAADNTISCASCHNPHDNAKRPFIRDNINATVYTEGDFATWCRACHVNRALNANAGTRINHPANDNLISNAVTSITDFASIGGNFKSAVSNLNIEITANSGAGVTGASWNLGGHVFASGGNNMMNCGTCHAVHSNETGGAGWATDDGATTVGTAVTNANGFLAVYSIDPTAGAVAAICSNCHSIAATRGPGATGTFSHAYQEVGPWSVTLTNVNSATYGSPKFGGTFAVDGTGATLVCQSCHDMHFARLAGGGTVLPQANWALMRIECDECHGASVLANHHPSGVTVEFGTAGSAGTYGQIYQDGAGPGPFVSTAMNWATIDNAAKVMNNTTSRANLTQSTNRYTFGGASNNIMTCGTCHGGWNAKAHNNLGAFPGLTGTVAQDEMCVDCHGTNPSYGSPRWAAGRAGTHMVGVPAVGGNIATIYMWNYGAATAVTPASGDTPVYGTGQAANGALICRSCHTLQTRTHTGQYSNNVGDQETSTKDNVALLLSPSGNAKEDVAATQNDFLCTACHGATPGGGFTHVTEPTYTTAATMAATINAGGNYVSTEANRINCESCHRPHLAATNGLTLIIEQAGAATTYVQEETLCNVCHSK